MFPPWALSSLQLKFNYRNMTHNPPIASSGQHNRTNNTGSRNKSMFIVVPYTKGLSEKFKKICNSLGMQLHLKGNNTIPTVLMAPKDKDNMCQKSRVIYWFKCAHTDCPEQYIGELGRTFGDKFREHLRAPSPIYQQSVHRTSSEFGMLHHN